jgi:argininosuccinate lyase
MREGFMEATDLADYLVRKGVAFREAHGVIGRIVRRCIELGRTLGELPIEEYRVFSAAFEKDLYAAIRPETIVAQRDNPGGTAPRRVRAALARARRMIEK